MDKKEKIKKLRKEVYSYREIVKLLRVSKREITKVVKQVKFSKKGSERYYKKSGVVKPIKKQTKKLTLAKTSIIGHLLFDGYLQKKTKDYKNTLGYVNASKNLVNKFCNYIIKVYGLKPLVYSDSKGKTLVYRARCNSKLIYNDLLSYIPNYSTSNNQIKVPDEIINARKDIKIEFIRSFWEDEGSVSKEAVIRGAINSFKIIKQLNVIHHSLNLETKIYLDKSKKKISYILRLKKDKENMDRFYNYSLFSDSIVTRGYFKGQRKVDVLKYFITHKYRNL